MIRVAFDQQVFSWQEYGGISRYICGLASRLSEIPGVAAKIVAPFSINAYLPHLDESLRKGIRVAPYPLTYRLRVNASRLAALPLLRAFRPDIVHETYYSAWTYAPRGARRVLTAQDMIHERFPGNFRKNDPTTSRKRKAFARTDRIICASESTRRDVREFFDIPAEKLAVVYHGFDSFGGVREEGGTPGSSPYLLYVGHRGGHKNFTVVAGAYTSSRWLRNNFRLVCFGGGAFTPAEKEMLARQGADESHVQQIGGGDSVLAACYRHAAVLVYPSLYEGFGIPPLEAMSVGCPVVCSNASSIPEVVGGAGEYFDPVDVDSLRSTLERVLHSSERRSDLVAQGFERCKSFSWERCAAETLAVYKSM